MLDETAPEKKPDKEKPATYYCLRGQYAFALDVWEKDINGEVVKNQKGNPVPVKVTDTDGNNPHKIHQAFKFDRLPILDPKTGRTNPLIHHGIFVISEDNPERWERRQELIEYLEKSRKNPHAHVVNLDDYKKQRNPEAFAMEQKFVDLKATNAQLEADKKVLMDKLEAAGISID